MTTEREGLAEEIAGVLGEHLPRDRYRDDGEAVGTFCTCGGWTGDYFADGESGPFDRHLADVLADVLAARDRRVRGEAKVAGYVLAVTDAHNRDGCDCGGECFRLDPIRKRIEADA